MRFRIAFLFVLIQIAACCDAQKLQDGSFKSFSGIYPHLKSNQLFIGPYAIDVMEKIRTISYGAMQGRHTGNARQLADASFIRTNRYSIIYQ